MGPAFARSERPGFLHLVDDDCYRDWEAVYRDNVGHLYRLLYSRVGNRPDAEDLTAEVFRRALGPLRVGSPKNQVRAYLVMTARTVLATHWRTHLGRQVTSIDPETDIAYLSEAPDLDAGREAERRALRILEGLPERYRRILELRFLERLSVKEAAEKMDVTVTNAKVMQLRALRMASRVAAQLEEGI